VHEYSVSDSERVPLEPNHVVFPDRGCRLSVGDSAEPRSTSRQGGHSHHSGSPFRCNVGSAGKLRRHRPHCRSSGVEVVLRRGSGMTLLARSRERRRACVRGDNLSCRRAQTRRPYQVPPRHDSRHPGRSTAPRTRRPCRALWVDAESSSA
jgi:hypothetical protein